MTPERPESERRVLILAPSGKDAVLTHSILRQKEIQSCVCIDGAALEDAAAVGAGCLLVAEEALAKSGDLLSDLVSRQPSWSDIPVLILTLQGADSKIVARAASRLGNVTLLERPVRVSTLISAISVALRARERQYQIREHLLERQRSEQALLEADRHKNEFLSTLSHELRNPLAAIHNSLHLLDVADKTDSTVSYVRGVLGRQVGHIVRLVDDLLEISRITRGTIELRKERVLLGAVIQSAVETTQPFLDAGHHELAIKMPPEPLLVDADPVRLAQVIANLLNNASKYSGTQGRIELTVQREGQDIAVSVRDHGIGIPPEKLPRVFDMFVQVDNALHLTQGGLGIGLTLARNLVELHGGSIEARSKGVGKGSEFIVRLPVFAGETAIPHTPQRSTSSPSVSQLSVLVVDDNKDVADTIGRMLHVMGAETRVVHDGPSALTALQSYRPDVVLLDLGMPGMTGYEVAERIRARPELRDIVLVALSGWGQEEYRLRSSAAGIDHHLIKPASFEALQALLVAVQSRSSKSGKSTLQDIP